MAMFFFCLCVIGFLGVIVAALDNLKAAVDANTQAVTAAIAKLGQPSPPPVIVGVAEADVQAQADAIARNNADLNAALNPPPAPAP